MSERAVQNMVLDDLHGRAKYSGDLEDVENNGGGSYRVKLDGTWFDVTVEVTESDEQDEDEEEDETAEA